MLNFDLPNTLPLVLILMAFVPGAFDSMYYHNYKFKLYSSPTSRGEMLTHLGRGFMFGIGTYFLANYELKGAWVYLVAGIFSLDFFNSSLDAYLEPASRVPFGGVPKGEYMLHIVGSTFSGAITMSYFMLFWKSQNEVTALVPLAQGMLPEWLKVSGQFIAVSSVLGTLIDLGLFLRAIRAQPSFVSR